MFKREKTMLVCAAATSFAAACSSPAVATDATAQLQGPDGENRGEVAFVQTENGVLLTAELRGLPEGEHGFHVHRTGECAPSFGAADGHLVGDAEGHGFLTEVGPHAGDMPNIHVPSSGELTIEVLNPRVSLHGGEAPLLDADGSAIVIHARGDDYESQPSGDAANRIACGVVAANAG